MTRKDYIVIADVLKEHFKEGANNRDLTLTNKFADALRAENPRFLRDRFTRYIFGNQHDA